MTLTAWLAHILGVPSGEQVGFLLSILLAFALGWSCKAIRDDRRRKRREEAFWKGVKLERVRR